MNTQNTPHFKQMWVVCTYGMRGHLPVAGAWWLQPQGLVCKAAHDEVLSCYAAYDEVLLLLCSAQWS